MAGRVELYTTEHVLGAQFAEYKGMIVVNKVSEIKDQFRDAVTLFQATSYR